MLEAATVGRVCAITYRVQTSASPWPSPRTTCSFSLFAHPGAASRPALFALDRGRRKTLKPSVRAVEPPLIPRLRMAAPITLFEVTSWLHMRYMHPFLLILQME